MNRNEGFKLLMNYGIEPLPAETIIFDNTTNGASGEIEIAVAGWYYIKMAGGGASAQKTTKQSTASGSSAAGFIGEIYLSNGIWFWQVGRKGVANKMENGVKSFLLKYDNINKGIICNAGEQTGYYPAEAPQGGILELKNIETRNVILASNGNNGYAGGSGTFETRVATSVLQPYTGDYWGAGGTSSNDNAAQGCLLIKFMGV